MYLCSKPSTRSQYYVCQKVDINHIFIIVGLTKQWAVADPHEEGEGWGNNGQRMKNKLKRNVGWTDILKNQGILDAMKEVNVRSTLSRADTLK